MKLLSYIAIAGLLAACSANPPQGPGPGSDRAEFSDSYMDCMRIAKRMNRELDDSNFRACRQDKITTPDGG